MVCTGNSFTGKAFQFLIAVNIMLLQMCIRDRLYISQQALSRCIQNLETELGCKLFHRTAKGSSLTEEGQYLYDQFAPLIESFRQKQEEAFSQISSRPQKITIASAPLMFSVLDTELLFSFKEQHPKMELDLKEMSDSEVVDYVDADASHLGIIADPRHHLQALFHFTEVKSYPICICINKDHPLASRESLDLSLIHIYLVIDVCDSLADQLLTVKLHRISILVVDVTPECLELLLVEVVIQGIFLHLGLMAIPDHIVQSMLIEDALNEGMNTICDFLAALRYRS